MAELDKKEHKNWVMVGCALNITKNGITPKIQKEMETWYQSLISSSPLQSLASCTCTPAPGKCATCVKWESELTRLHRSMYPRIYWKNSDRKQWGSPTGAWEIAKIFMPFLGNRKTHVIDAETTDIGGLLNLLECCPFIHPSLSPTVLSSARDGCRNHWAHAPKHELQDADVPTIFAHLNSLLSDPVFNADSAAQRASKDLQDLIHQGVVNVRESEVEALRLLGQSLVADLTNMQDSLDNIQDKVSQLALAVDNISGRLTDRNDQEDGCRNTISQLHSTHSSTCSHLNDFQMASAEVCHTPNMSKEKKCVYELACDYIYYYRLGIEAYRSNTKFAVTLRRMGSILEKDHYELFKTMMVELKLTTSSAASTFMVVAEGIFRTGINWGRIVALFCFAGEVAVFCSQYRIVKVEDVVGWLSQFVCETLAEWVKESGGWDAFCEVFKDEHEYDWKFFAMPISVFGLFFLISRIIGNL